MVVRADLLLHNVHLATMVRGEGDYGAVRRGAVLVTDGRLDWIGREADIPEGLAVAEELDCGGRWATPGLVDCHTHLVFGGNRAQEFERRLAGAAYEEIAREGGGILSTVAATRTTSEENLEAAALRRLATLHRRGVTTVEVKSGYGLDLDSEMKMLRVGRRLASATGLTVQTTLLGAHALPSEYVSDRDGYLRLVREEMIPRVVEGGLADAVDAFCEGIAFTAEECASVLGVARAAGLPVRLHADQLSDLGGAALAARLGARTADHLEHAAEVGVRAMAGAGTVAVLLPGAAHFLRDGHVPPVESFRRHGVPMAVATDLNPGSSPLLDPGMALSLACLLFGLTPEEALAGMTRHAARALGLSGELGTLEAGKRADLALWSVDHPAELSDWMGGDCCWRVVLAGMPGPQV
ncbi:MAG: imidazolonepropionase [Gemmatimonadota bacterium]